MANFENMDYLNSFLTTGALVCTKDNVMTASWGFVGVMFRKKCVVLPIRTSRYTKGLLDETGIFTLSIPSQGTMKEALAICGTKSGRDTDKWKAAKIERQKAKAVDTNVVKGCAHYIECKIITCVPMTDTKGIEEFYTTGDMHNLYIAEIVEEY